MNRNLLTSAICASLLMAGSAYAQTTPANAQNQSTGTQSQQNTNTNKKKKPETLKQITVTGSLIPQSQIETATPVITITAQDLQQQGFKNVYQALHALPIANGAVQGNTFTQGFTPGLETISLLGLPPQFTLLLVDGRPLADYPLPYNGQATVNNFASIPVALVDRIEIVPGNQSAIYGSQAIAGVVNIILKQHYQGVDLDYRAGGYTDGGGQQQRLNITAGDTFGKWNLMGSVTLNKQNPIFAFQRSYTDSTKDSPNPVDRVPAETRVEINAFGNPNVPPPFCNSSLFHGTNHLADNDVYGGAYCGSFQSPAEGTLLNGSKEGDFYGRADYQLNDNTQLYADLLYNLTKTTYLTGGYYSVFWEPGFGVPGYIYDLDAHQLVRGYHVFAPEEVGDQANAQLIDHSYVFDAGIKGSFGASNWNYSAYVHRSQTLLQSNQMRPLTDLVNSWFLGPQDGVGPYGYGYPAYHLEKTGHFWGTTTPEQFLAFSGNITSHNETYSQQATAQVTNTDLFNLPWYSGGSVGFAAQLTRGNQLWDNPIDPRVLAGDFWGIGGTSGEGKRGFESGAVELDVPVFKMLTVDLAGRYDRYMPDGGDTQSKFTYKVGFEFRPISTLLLRANYATAFRAPNMQYVYSKGSKAFNNGVVDVYNCRRLYGNTLGNCKAPYNSVNNVIVTSIGNRDLKYVTAKSWGYGAVWSPTQHLTLKSDYYHVKVANEVNTYSTAQLLTNEAACRLGSTIQGNPVDGSTPACQQFDSWVDRAPVNSPIPGIVQGVTALPINISKETVSGIQSGGNFKWSWGRFGDFDVGLDYSVQTEHTKQAFPNQAPSDLLRTNSYGNQFKDIGDATLSWNIGKWSTTILYQRFGKTFSVNGHFTVGPWMLYNATVQYHVTPDITASLIGNNIFNARPPYDASDTTYPYFDQFSYTPYGRLVMVELNVHFR